MKTLPVILLCLLISSCQTLNSEPDVLLPTSRSTLNLQADHVQPCADLPLLTNGAEPDIIAHYKAIANSYKACAATKKSLVDLLCGRLFNCVIHNSSE